MSAPLGNLVEPAPPARLPEGQPLEGVFVRLRAPDPVRDSAALFPPSHGSVERESVWTYLHQGPFHSAAEMTGWITEQLRDSPNITYTVEDRISGRPVGMCQYLAIVATMRRIEIGGIWYLPEHQRSKANTEAAYLLLRHAFEDLGYRRVEWKCNDLNAPSRRAAQRLGFSYEGTFRQHMIVKGRNRDTAWFAMLDSDWPSIRPRLERWLYELPVDATGRPCEPLRAR